MEISLYQLYTSFQVARSMWLLKIHRLFLPSLVKLLVAISGSTCAQPTMFPTLETCKATAAGAFSLLQLSRRDPSYPSFQVVWLAPGLISTQRKLHPCYRAWFWMVIAVTMADVHSACYNCSPDIVLPTPSHSIDPLRASPCFLFIDTSEICTHHLNPQLKPYYQSIYRAPLHEVVHPICMSCYNSYGG
jgi:hypothetical protein